MKNSINNVNNYILGRKYNRNTIIDDINTSIDLLTSNSTYYLLNELRNNLNIYLSRNADVCVNYINFVVNCDCDNFIVYNIYEKYKLPFIHSDYPLADRLILSKLFNIDNIILSDAIYCLACYKDKTYLSLPKVREMLYSFLGLGQIDFIYYGVNPMLGYVDKFSESDEEIVDNMEELKHGNTKLNHNNVVGHYSEYVVYEYLNERLNNNQDLRWVSRDIGDGFGYDIAIINPNYSASLYEVKGLYDRDYLTISDNEKSLINYSLERDDLSYHIMAVLNKYNDSIIDIQFDKDNNINYNFIGNNNFNLEYRDKDNKILIRK